MLSNLFVARAVDMWWRFFVTSQNESNFQKKCKNFCFLLRIFIQLTSSFPVLAEIIPRSRRPMRHQANLMFGCNNYRAFHRPIPMHTGKTGKFGLQENRQSSVSAALRHVPHVQMYTAAIQMYSSGTLVSVGITLIKMLPNHSVHTCKNFLY